MHRDHQKNCRTSYSRFHAFPGPRPDSRTFHVW